MSAPTLSYVFSESLWAHSTVEAMSVAETTIYLPNPPPYRGWTLLATINLTALLPWELSDGTRRIFGFASTRVASHNVIHPDGSVGRYQTQQNPRVNSIQALHCTEVTFRLGCSISEACAAALVFLYQNEPAPTPSFLSDGSRHKRLVITVRNRRKAGPTFSQTFVAVGDAEMPPLRKAAQEALNKAQAHWDVPRAALDHIVLPARQSRNAFEVDWQSRRVRAIRNSLLTSDLGSVRIKVP